MNGTAPLIRDKDIIEAREKSSENRIEKLENQ
jgi:hypothetical protein